MVQACLGRVQRGGAPLAGDRLPGTGNQGATCAAAPHRSNGFRRRDLHHRAGGGCGGASKRRNLLRGASGVGSAGHLAVVALADARRAGCRPHYLAVAALVWAIAEYLSQWRDRQSDRGQNDIRRERFRPIMLTAISTVLGMIPIAPTIF